MVGGYIGSARQWLQLETQWEAVLKEFDVRDLHSKDVFAFDERGRHAGSYRRFSAPSEKCSYGDWSREKVEQFIARLLGVIDARGVYPLGAMVTTADFWALTYGDRRFLTGGQFDGRNWRTSGAPTKPYFLLFDHCLVQAATRTKAGKRTLFVFDQQRQYESRALEQFNESYRLLVDKHDPIAQRIAGIIFHDRTDAPGLQAADLYVHCWNRYATNSDRVGPQRMAALDVLTNKYAMMGHYTAAHLETMLAKLPAHVRAALGEARDPDKS